MGRTLSQRLIAYLHLTNAGSKPPSNHCDVEPSLTRVEPSLRLSPVKSFITASCPSLSAAPSHPSPYFPLPPGTTTVDRPLPPCTRISAPCLFPHNPTPPRHHCNVDRIYEAYLANDIGSAGNGAGAPWVSANAAGAGPRPASGPRAGRSAGPGPGAPWLTGHGAHMHDNLETGCRVLDWV